jgi:hypothetical protein
MILEGRKTIQAMKDALENLMGQKVEVIYEGIVYRGILVASSNDEVHLQTIMEWVSLPIEGIGSIKKAEG